MIPHQSRLGCSRGGDTMRRLTVFGLMIIVTALACSIPGLPGGEAQPGTQDNPVPAGEPISYEWGTLRVTAFHRPTAFQVLKADLFTGITESRPAKPATGAEFVSIELEAALEGYPPATHLRLAGAADLDVVVEGNGLDTFAAGDFVEVAGEKSGPALA